MSDPGRPAAAEAPLLVARGLHKTYTLEQRAVEVLCGVDLEIQRGAFVALRGASGAGKSTLLRLLGGLDTPTAGEVEFRGLRLGSLSAGALATFRNREVGFVFQAYHLLPDLEAIENVCVPARMARVPAAESERRGRELLERVGLGHRLNHRPAELSGGEQQRVAIARALVNNPALLLADEPTGNLESHTGGEIIDLLCALQTERSMTLLMATHDHHVAARAPRILDLQDGRVVAGWSVMRDP